MHSWKITSPHRKLYKVVKSKINDCLIKITWKIKYCLDLLHHEYFCNLWPFNVMISSGFSQQLVDEKRWQIVSVFTHFIFHLIFYLITTNFKIFASILRSCFFFQWFWSYFDFLENIHRGAHWLKTPSSVRLHHCTVNDLTVRFC